MEVSATDRAEAITRLADKLGEARDTLLNKREREMQESFNSKILRLIGEIETKADTAFDLSQSSRKASASQKRLIKAYALLRDAADEVRLAGADI